MVDWLPKGNVIGFLRCHVFKQRIFFLLFFFLRRKRQDIFLGCPALSMMYVTFHLAFPARARAKHTRRPSVIEASKLSLEAGQMKVLMIMQLNTKGQS